MEDKRLFLLDAYALIYRAYYALIRAPRITSQGMNTSAIFGFVNTLDEILKKENPTHIAVCFDPKGDTFRHRMYDQYKAQRQAQPEDITIAVPFIKDIIRAYNIAVIEVPGYEADDVIGTLAHRAQTEGFTTYMMTPDKDFGQLVTDKVLMYRPALGGRDFEIRGPQEVCQRYGISSPLQVIDLLALEGDASDNIPGCPGVGEKTAVKLITEYGSVDNLIAHASEIKGALGKKIAENTDKILLSRTLATIATDVPVDVSLDSLRRQKEDTEALREIYTQLEFKTFLNRLAPSVKEVVPTTENSASEPLSEPSLFDQPDSSSSAQPSLFDIDYNTPIFSAPKSNTSTVTDLAEICKIVSHATSLPYVGISIYAPGVDDMSATLKGIAICHGDDTDYIPIPSDKAQAREIITAIEPLFTTTSTTVISHDIKHDIVVLRNVGINWQAPYYDTSVAHYLLQPEMRHRLSDVALSVLKVNTIEYSDTVRAKTPWPEYPEAQVAARTSEAASLMLPLREKLNSMLGEVDMLTLLNEIELPLIEVLADMEYNGMRIDVAELNNLSVDLTARLNEMEEKVYELAGRRFNIASPKQVGEILFEHLAIGSKAKRTKRGNYSTSEEVLESYRHTHPIVGIILDIRALNKLLSTYVNALPELINPLTGKIHTIFNQTVTATGRISSANPNLQNIPVRTEDGREIRRAFIADDGDMILSADYSQIELRIMADLSKDTTMIEAFNSGADIHRATAAKIYHLPIENVTDDLRRNAKTANFGIIYGISSFGLSQRLGVSRKDAKTLIDGYFNTYPGVQQYIDGIIAQARETGYVTTITSRRRYLPDINSRNAALRSFAERNAVNAPIQGSAADIIKRAMIAIYRRMKAEGLKSKMLLQVHDELVFNAVVDELPTLQQLVKEEMRQAYHGAVTMEVSYDVAHNWLEAH